MPTFIFFRQKHEVQRVSSSDCAGLEVMLKSVLSTHGKHIYAVVTCIFISRKTNLESVLFHRAINRGHICGICQLCYSPVFIIYVIVLFKIHNDFQPRRNYDEFVKKLMLHRRQWCKYISITTRYYFDYFALLSCPIKRWLVRHISV